MMSQLQYSKADCCRLRVKPVGMCQGCIALTSVAGSCKLQLQASRAHLCARSETADFCSYDQSLA